MNGSKYNEGDVVKFTERSPLWFQEQHNPETTGTIIRKEGRNYLIKINNTENEFVVFSTNYFKKNSIINLEM